MNENSSRSRCSAFLVKAIVDMSNQAPYQGIALSNPINKRMEKDEMVKHLAVECGQDFLQKSMHQLFDETEPKPNGSHSFSFGWLWIILLLFLQLN